MQNQFDMDLNVNKTLPLHSRHMLVERGAGVHHCLCSTNNVLSGVKRNKFSLNLSKQCLD